MSKSLRSPRIPSTRRYCWLAAWTTGSSFRPMENTWRQIPGNPSRSWVFAFGPIDPNLIYAGANTTDVLRSREKGRTWKTRNSGLFNRPVPTISYVETRRERIVAGSVTEGVFRSDDFGRTWETRNSGLSDFSIIIVRSGREGDVVAADAWGGFFVSQDCGDSEILADPESLVNTITIAETQPLTLYVGPFGDAVLPSRNLETTWNPINQGLTSVHIKLIVVDPADPNRVFVATIAGLFSSTDGGDTWQPEGLSDDSILDLWVDAENSSTLYALPRFRPGLFRTASGVI